MTKKPYTKPVNKRRATKSAVEPQIGRPSCPTGWWDVPARDGTIRAVRLSSIDEVVVIDRGTQVGRCAVVLRSGVIIALSITMAQAFDEIALAEKHARGNV